MSTSFWLQLFNDNKVSEPIDNRLRKKILEIIGDPENITTSNKTLSKDPLALTTLPKPGNVFFRILRHPLLMPYNRLAALMLGINIFILFQNSDLVPIDSPYSFALNMTLINFLIAVFIRQQQVINLLFKFFTGFPHFFPLWIRWACGKVYHFGGIHVGSYLAGYLWYAYSIYLLQFTEDGSSIGNSTFISTLSLIHLAILTVIMISALPSHRAKHHNRFEKIARFGNWISLSLFWIQTIAIINERTIGSNTEFPIVASPEFYGLLLITFLFSVPWLRLKKVPVSIDTPSNHVAISNFNYGVTPFEGSSTDLSLSPLMEWHSFANIPSPGESGFRLTISRAGDWTGNLIDKKPSHIWVKGIPAAGVGNIEKLFKKVIWVATGSGIGPCLPHLLTGKIPSVLVWATRNPVKTYGEKMVSEIKAAQPDAIIWDTDSHGKPDLVDLALKTMMEHDAEAVICISNKKLTWHVVYQLEIRGIPAFGAIWDS